MDKHPHSKLPHVKIVLDYPIVLVPTLNALLLVSLSL